MKAKSRYTAEQFFRKAIFAEHQFAVASKTLNCFWIYGQRLKNTLGSWFLVKLLALELFPQKQIYWTPFGGCLESYFQLQFPVHYEKFFNFFTSSFYHMENKFKRFKGKISWLISVWLMNWMSKYSFLRAYVNSEAFDL